jgi:hypothetical protein
MMRINTASSEVHTLPCDQDLHFDSFIAIALAQHSSQSSIVTVHMQQLILISEFLTASDSNKVDIPRRNAAV